MTLPGPARAQLRRAWLRGALTLPLIGLVIGAASARYWPDAPVVGHFGRLLDSLAPQLLLLALPLIALLAWLGARRLGAALALMVLLAAGHLLLEHLGRAAPARPDAPVDLRVLWFNVKADTETAPARLAAALRDSGADIVMVTEAAPLRPRLAALETTYPHRLGCHGRACEIVILSRLPFAQAEIRALGQPKPERLLSVQIETEAGARVSLLATHLAKPWFYGWIERDRWFLLDQLARLDGPVIVAGDFNAAPWSRRMGVYFAKTGLAPPRRPVPSWPAWLGGLGVPIDHILLRDGADLVSLSPWGADLGSNHRGLLAEISLRPDPL